MWPGIDEKAVIDKLTELSKEYFEAYTLEAHGYLEMNPSVWDSDKFKLQMLLNGIEQKNNRPTPFRESSRSSPESLFYYMLKVGFGQQAYFYLDITYKRYTHYSELYLIINIL